MDWLENLAGFLNGHLNGIICSSLLGLAADYTLRAAYSENPVQYLGPILLSTALGACGLIPEKRNQKN